jgi:Alw26I/Eco31I/Esp3I family type II restriction endonuclease
VDIIKVSGGTLPLKRLREKRELLQEAFAEICGMHRTYISAVERRRRSISLYKVQRIADALRVETYILFLEEDDAVARKDRTWHLNFTEYMEMIAAHPNYQGLEIGRKQDGSLDWVVTAKSKIGQARKKWAGEKAITLGLTVQPGVYARVMREIHPTKEHVCQICGSMMSIYYHYPNVSFIKAIDRQFGIVFSECDHIMCIWEQISENGATEDSIKQFLQDKFRLDDISSKTRSEIVAMCEYECRVNDKKYLGPGAMSNFPDRYDGFHTYGRCCRAAQDTGRSKENLKSYTKDRRAYECWSDGNLHAADAFMGSSFFKGTSADHIGAISLGFVHDPRYLRPMTSSDNSTKRDRLLTEDIKAVIAVEESTGIPAMSWYSAQIWDFIKQNYQNHPELVPTVYRDYLKQNMANYMFILKKILEIAAERGKEFLDSQFISSKADDFEYTYVFDNDGNIKGRSPRHHSKCRENELDRFRRIAFNAVSEYGEKSNRHTNQDLAKSELAALERLCLSINNGERLIDCRRQLNILMDNIQERLIG